MERRVLLALFLSFLVFYIYEGIMPKPVPPVGTGQAPAATTASSETPAAPVAPSPPSAAPPAPAPAPSKAAPAAAVIGETSEREITIETQRVVAVFTNRGGRLRSWRLKDYKNQQSNEPLELVPHELEDTHPLPFSLQTSDPQSTEVLNDSLYRVTREDTESGRPAVLTFEYSNTAGLRVSKTFTIEPASYKVTFQASVSNDGQPVEPTIEWGPGLADQGSETSRFRMKPEGLVFINNDVKRYSSSAVAKQATYEGTFRFAGIEDHYFMSAALDPGPSTIAYRAVSIPPPAGSKASARDLMAYSLTPGKTGSPITFFVGPKEFDVLAALDPAFVKAINFGLFAVIVVPLLRTLV
jgi:YidC/Oxa1 family membrane protein insertase